MTKEKAIKHLGFMAKDKGKAVALGLELPNFEQKNALIVDGLLRAKSEE